VRPIAKVTVGSQYEVEVGYEEEPIGRPTKINDLLSYRIVSFKAMSTIALHSPLNISEWA